MPSRPRSAASRRCSVVNTASLPITTPASFAPISAPQSHQGREIRIARVARTWATPTQVQRSSAPAGCTAAGCHSSSCASFGSRSLFFANSTPSSSTRTTVSHTAGNLCGTPQALAGRPSRPDGFGGPLDTLDASPRRSDAPSPHAPAQHPRPESHRPPRPCGRPPPPHRGAVVGGRARRRRVDQHRRQRRSLRSVQHSRHRLAGRLRPARGPLLRRERRDRDGRVLRRRRAAHRPGCVGDGSHRRSRRDREAAGGHLGVEPPVERSHRASGAAGCLPAGVRRRRGAAARAIDPGADLPRRTAWPTPR